MDAVELVRFSEEGVRAEVPRDVAGVRHDARHRRPGDEAAGDLVEVPAIGERQGLAGTLLRGGGRGGGRRPVRVKWSE